MGDQAWNFVGHQVGPQELDVIRSVVGECAGLSRDELACTVCELLGWTRASGRLKARECRDLLARLEAAGVVTLPAKGAAGLSGSTRPCRSRRAATSRPWSRARFTTWRRLRSSA